jgi:hypothetical protein
LAIFFDLVCAAYQAVDSYKRLFPGSKIAANILLNRQTQRAWEAYYWIFAVIASILNLYAVRVWIVWLSTTFRLQQRLERILKSAGVRVLLSLCLFFIILPALMVTPLWMACVLRYPWQTIAWKHVCVGWDYTILLDAISWDKYNSNPNQTHVGNAIVLAAHGNFTIQLFHDVHVHNVFTFNVSETFNNKSLIPSIIYNLTDLTYKIGNVINSFNVTPSLSIPSLHLDVRDPSIPFIRSDKSYPPSADLVYRNETTLSNVFKTFLLNFPSCTEMKACGMQDHAEAFQVALGVVMIEQFRASLYCTVPSNETVQGL